MNKLPLALAALALLAAFVFAGEGKKHNDKSEAKKLSKEECARYEFRDFKSDGKNGFYAKIFKDGVDTENTILESSEKSKEILNDINEVSRQCDTIKGESEKYRKQRHEKRNQK